MGKSSNCWWINIADGILVGGLEHEFYDFPYIGNGIIPTDFRIFFRRVQTTKQLRFMTYVYRNVKKSGFGDDIRYVNSSGFQPVFLPCLKGYHSLAGTEATDKTRSSWRSSTGNKFV